MRDDSFRMMLGFVVRSCAVELGHHPSPDELASWANSQRDQRGDYRIFGRPISSREAAVILRNPERMVAVRRSSLRPRAAAEAPGAQVLPFRRRG